MQEKNMNDNSFTMSCEIYNKKNSNKAMVEKYILYNPVLYWTLWPVIIEILEQNLSVLPYFLASLLSMPASERVGELPCREQEEWPHLDIKCMYLIYYILWPIEETIISYNLPVQFSSVQFSCSVMSDSLQPHGLQHARLLWSSPTHGTYSNSCP